MTATILVVRPTQSTREQNLRAGRSLLSPEGWAYASAIPVDAADPGRFHCLFGRDSLIFALQVLPVLPQVAAATLRALAARQGRRLDPQTEEEPGRILHEFRETVPDWLIAGGWPVRDGQLRYYGSSDATSWFLVLLAATGDPDLQRELGPNAARAADWLDRSLVRGRGFVRCGPRVHPGGLAQQGWRDTLDPTVGFGGGIVGPDGAMPLVPMADADSQAVAVAALDALTRLQPERAGHWQARADTLRMAIETRFTPDVMALDGADRPVPGAGSQLGWLLWADALSPAAAAAAAERLTRPDVLTPFGVRTLSRDHPQFRADGYHRGTVWPFDSWLCWGGLRAVRHPDADVVRDGVREALTRLGHYPELYRVDDALDDPADPAGPAVARVATANQVQAWTVGAAIAFDNDWGGRENQ